MANDPQSFTQAAAAQYAATQKITPNPYTINPLQGMSPAQIAAYNQQLWAGVATQKTYHAAQQRHMWMWNGIPMSIEDFAERAYGDTAERTHFILKYKDIL